MPVATPISHYRSYVFPKIICQSMNVFYQKVLQKLRIQNIIGENEYRNIFCSQNIDGEIKWRTIKFEK